MVTKTSFFHLWNRAAARAFINQKDAEKRIHVFISSQLVYCNSLSLFSCLQVKKRDVSSFKTQLLSSAVNQNQKERAHSFISSCSALASYKALNGLGPSYIANSILDYLPSTLQWSSVGLLVVSSNRTSGMQDHASKHLNNAIGVREAKYF